MSQAVTVSPKTIEEIISRLDNLSKEIRVIKERLFASEPPYGSEEWWEWSDKKALEDVKEGRVSGPFKNATQLIKALHQEANK